VEYTRRNKVIQYKYKKNIDINKNICTKKKDVAKGPSFLNHSTVFTACDEKWSLFDPPHPHLYGS
jgi:hypothetical protein